VRTSNDPSLRSTSREQVASAREQVETSETGGTERAALAATLQAEYSLLSSMLSAVWSASLSRVSLFLGVVSAMGVALGFAAQAGGGFGGTFIGFALVALPLALLLGLGTFVRTVELQREAYVYITGMNRIRHAMAEAVPTSRPYFVLSIYDDARGVFRSQGTGIRLRPPRPRLVFALVQTQGIVAVICGALACIISALTTSSLGPAVAWTLGGLAFVVTVVGLFTYWNHSIARLQAAIRPRFPTPPEEIDAPI